MSPSHGIADPKARMVVVLAASVKGGGENPTSD
jgi:hypothetical protein